MSQFFKERAHNNTNLKVYRDNYDGIDWSSLYGKKPKEDAQENVKEARNKTPVIEEVKIVEGDFDSVIDQANLIRTQLMEKGYTEFSILNVPVSVWAEDGHELSVVGTKYL